MPRFYIFAGFLGAVETVLGGVERHEIAVLSQQDSCPNSPRIDTGLVGDKSDPFSFEDGVIAFFENVDSELNCAGRCGSHYRDKKCEQNRLFILGAAD